MLPFRYGASFAENSHVLRDDSPFIDDHELRAPGKESRLVLDKVPLNVQGHHACEKVGAMTAVDGFVQQLVGDGEPTYASFFHFSAFMLALVS